MTISTQISKAAFSGNGVSTVFPLPFPFQRAADIKALLRHDGFETPLTQGGHYEMSGAGNASGGSLTMLVPPATGQTLVVWRAPALVQEVDYVENSAFPAETHEAALDLLTMICQSLQEQIGRAVLYPVSTPDEDIMDSAAFLAATSADKNDARASAQNAAASASQALASASQAGQSALDAGEIAATADGLVKVSAGDARGRSLSAKLLAGNGLAEGIENPGGDESLRLSVALAGDPGLEFAAGLLRIKAGTGLVRSASGLAADVGASAGKLVQLDANGRLPALDARNLTNLQNAAPDLAAFNTFMALMQAGHATCPVPGGGAWLLATDELTRSGATYSSTSKSYSNTPTLLSNFVPAMTSNSMNGFTASASSVYSGADAYAAYRAFDQSDANKWLAAASTGTLTLTWSTGPVLIAAVTMKCDAETTRAPRDFSIEASNGGGAWTTVYTGSGVSWTSLETKQFNFPLVYATHLRIVVSGIAGDYVAIGNLGIPGVTAANMSISTTSGVALAAVPTKATIYVLHKALDAVAYNTDVKVYISRTVPATWTTVSQCTDLAEVCQYDNDYKLLKATLDLTAQASGSTGKWALLSFNSKVQQVRAALVLFQ